MKIVFVLDCAHNLTNGTTATCVRFAEELRKRGHQVTIVGCSFEDGKEHKDYVGLPHYHFPLFQPLIEKEGFCFPKVDNRLLYEAIKDADVVHLFLPFKEENNARLIAQSLGVAVTGAFHLQPQNITGAIHLAWAGFINDILFYSFKRYLYQSVHYVHCPSKMIADQLVKHRYDRNEKVVISNGVTGYFHPVEAEKEADLKDQYVITMVGRLAGEKRQDLIIKAIAQSKYNSKIQLVLCGQGPDKNKLIRLAKKVGLTNPPRIEFCNQEKLRNILNTTDLYIHASDFEIEGIACIEAFACGAVPLISDAKLSATKDFSVDDEHCLFRHGNARDLKNRIEWFIEHPQEKEALKARYIEEAKQYQLSFMVDKMEQMLLKAVEEKKENKDIPTLYPRRHDIKKSRKIFKKLQKQGVVDSIPEYCFKKI